MSSFIANGGSYEWKITNNGVTYGDANLSGGKLTEGVYSQIGIGNVIAKQLNLVLYDVNIDPTYPIIPTVDATDNSGTTTTIGKGTYYVDTIEKSPYSDYTEITAYDVILKADVPYMKTGTWSTTDDETIVTDIATNVLGVSIESYTATLLSAPLTIDQAPDIGDNGTSCREMLSVIAVMRGGNWIINDADELEFVPLTGRLDPHATVTVGDEVVDFDVSPTETIKRVEIWSSSSASYRCPSGLTEAEWEAEGGIVLSANLPIMASQTLADDLYSAYNNFTYVPFVSNGAYVDVDIPLATELTIKNDTVVMSHRITNLDVLSPSDISANATQAQKSYYPYLSSSERALKTEVSGVAARITTTDDAIIQEVSRAQGAEDELGTRITQTKDDILQEFYDAESEQYKYIRYSAAGIELGEENSNFQARLSNTELAFTGSNGQKAAWISNTQLNINEAVIQESGDQKFMADSTSYWVQQVVDDHFQIKWVGN